MGIVVIRQMHMYNIQNRFFPFTEVLSYFQVRLKVPRWRWTVFSRCILPKGKTELNGGTLWNGSRRESSEQNTLVYSSYDIDPHVCGGDWSGTKRGHRVQTWTRGEIRVLVTSKTREVDTLSVCAAPVLVTGCLRKMSEVRWFWRHMISGFKDYETGCVTVCVKSNVFECLDLEAYK